MSGAGAAAAAAEAAAAAASAGEQQLALMRSGELRWQTRTGRKSASHLWVASRANTAAIHLFCLAGQSNKLLLLLWGLNAEKNNSTGNCRLLFVSAVVVVVVAGVSGSIRWRLKLRRTEAK